MVHMLAVRTRMREPFHAFRTLERLLTAVQSLVLGQMVFVFECFWANVALVRSLICNNKMIDQHVTNRIIYYY